MTNRTFDNKKPATNEGSGQEPARSEDADTGDGVARCALWLCVLCGWVGAAALLALIG